jgi:hypothetical protein
MKRPPHAFKEQESAILIVLYEGPGASHHSYTLMQILNPEIKTGTPEYQEVFTSIRDTTEDLIVQGLVRGERQKNLGGIYYNDLKLTPKGEKAAIQERRRKSEFEKALPQLIKDANAVAEEVKKFDEKE